MRVIGFCVTLLLLQTSGAVASSCLSEEAYYRTGYLSGESLAVMPDSALGGYLAGFVDGLLTAAMLRGTEQCAEEIWMCFDDSSLADVTTAFRTFLEDNPDRWIESGNILAFDALIEPCLTASNAAA
jgi:hypothetical protein